MAAAAAVSETEMKLVVMVSVLSAGSRVIEVATAAGHQLKSRKSETTGSSGSSSSVCSQLARPNQFIGSWSVGLSLPLTHSLSRSDQHSLEVQSGANHRLCITTQ